MIATHNFEGQEELSIGNVAILVNIVYIKGDYKNG